MHDDWSECDRLAIVLLSWARIGVACKVEINNLFSYGIIKKIYFWLLLIGISSKCFQTATFFNTENYFYLSFIHLVNATK
jgi:hypothetical protein